MIPKLSDVSSKYGAPMGRRTIIPDKNAKVKLHLVRLNFVDSAYDSMGAYWGMGNPIYRAVNNDNEIFVRAIDRIHAKKQILAQMPNATFYR
jgi:hypothetical protein